MNTEKYLSSKPEDTDNYMEWEDDEGIGILAAFFREDGTSSFDPNNASGFNFSQPRTSGCTDRKRKSSFSSPLQPKISRDIWNGKQQQEEHPSANETNNREVASGFSTVPSANHISSSFDPNISSVCTLSQPSTPGYTGRKSPPLARISRDIWSGKHQHEENSSLNETNPYNNLELASAFATAPPIPQMKQAEQRSISSQAQSVSLSSLLVKADKEHSRGDTSSDFLNQISLSFDPILASGYTLSQPSTSGYTSRKSPPPARISRDIWSRKQQHKDNSSLNKTNPHNNREMASGFATTSPISQMMQVEQRSISNQAYNDNISSLLVNADIERSKGDDYIRKLMFLSNPSIMAYNSSRLEIMREKIIHLLDVEVSKSDKEYRRAKGKQKEDEDADEIGCFFFGTEKLFCTALKLPEQYFMPLLSHLRKHKIGEISSRPAVLISCPLCKIFVSFPYFLEFPEYDY